MKRIAALLFIVFSLSTSTASAQDLTPEEIEAYRSAAGAAAEAYGVGEYSEAVQKLIAAREIYDHPDLTYNLGRSYQNMGWCARARDQFQKYVKRDDVGKKDRQKVAEQLATLSTCTESRQLTIHCEPSELEVELSPAVDEPAACGKTITITPGRYTLSARGEGYVDEMKTLSVTAESDDFDLTLAPELEESAEPVVYEEAPPADDGDWRPITGWSMVGAGGLMFVTALILDATSSRTDDLESAGTTTAIEDIESEASSRKGLIIGLYVGGAVVAAGGAGILTWYMLDQGDSDAELALSAASNGVVLHGKF